MRKLIISAIAAGLAIAGATTAQPAGASATSATQRVVIRTQDRVASYNDGWLDAKRDDADLLGHRMPNASEVQELDQARHVTRHGWACHLEWDGPRYPWYEAICAPKRHK